MTPTDSAHRQSSHRDASPRGSPFARDPRIDQETLRTAMTQLARGVALQAARRHAEALERFESIAADAPERAAARLHAAFSWLAVGDAAAARRAADEAVVRLPASSAAHFALGQCDLAL